MKPASFDYVRPTTLQAAVSAMSELDWGARLLAGGQSLVPMLNLRLAPVALLVDISKLEELRGAEDRGDRIVFGACLTHGAFEEGRLPDASNGLMQRVARHIAYRAIRNRGTIGGSVSLADPSADWITVLMALGAEFVIVGAQGKRHVPADQMFLGAYTTAIGEQEILTAIEVPKLSGGSETGYYKIIRKAGEYPMTTATYIRDRDRGISNLVLGASAMTQARLPKVSTTAENLSGWSEDAQIAVETAFQADMADLGRDGDGYLMKLCGTTVIRAVRQALENACKSPSN